MDPTIWFGFHRGDLLSLARRDDGSSVLTRLSPAGLAGVVLQTSRTPTVAASLDDDLCVADADLVVSCFGADGRSRVVALTGAEAPAPGSMPIAAAMLPGKLLLLVETAGTQRLLGIDTFTGRAERMGDGVERVGTDGRTVCWTAGGEVVRWNERGAERLGRIDDTALEAAAGGDACFVVHQGAMVKLTKFGRSVPPVDLLVSSRSVHVAAGGKDLFASTIGTEADPRSGSVYAIADGCRRLLAEGRAFTLLVAAPEKSSVFALVEPLEVGGSAYVRPVCVGTLCP